MKTLFSRGRSATFRKLFNLLSIAVISAAALSWQGCRSSSETTRSQRQTTSTTRIRDQQSFGAATLQQEWEQWKTAQPNVERVSLVLTDSMLLTLPTQANYQAGEGTPLHLSATRTGEGVRIEATTYGVHEQLGTRYRTVVADSMTDMTLDVLDAIATDTLAVRQTKERKTRSPAKWALALAAVGGAVAAFGIDRLLQRLI